MAALAEPLILRSKAAEGVRVEAGYIAAIEGLRGVAVLWVTIFHYVVMRDGRFDDPAIDAIGLVHPISFFARNGYLGVELFFLITGFLLTLPWFLRRAQGGPAPGIREFYVRRFWRIAPAYYVQLVLLFFFVLPLLKGITYWRSDLYVLVYNAGAHVTFLQNTTPLSSGSLAINGALWTLTAEAQYYVMVPLVAALFLRAPFIALGGALLLAALWRHGATQGLDGIVSLQMAMGTPWGWSEASIRQLLLTQIPSYAAHFAIGILAGRAWVEWRRRPPPLWVTRSLPVAAVAGLGLLYLFYGHLGPVFGEITGLIPALTLGAVLFAIAADDRDARHPILASAPLVAIGRISYSTYLYHLLVLTLWNRFMPPLGWLSLPLFLASVLAVGWLSWRYVEVPLLRKRRLVVR